MRRRLCPTLVILAAGLLALLTPDAIARAAPPSGEAAPGEWSRDEAVEQARRELARILSIEESALELVEVVAVEWRDSSLGCPSKASVYQPVIVPGYRVTFTARSARHRVHTGGGEAVVCTTGYRQTVPLPQRDESRLTLYRLAVEDLAERLDVAVSSITLLSVSPRDFTAAELDCSASHDESPSEGEPAEAEAEDGTIPGWVIQLAAGGVVHRYHGAGERVEPCPEQQAPAEPEDGQGPGA